MSFTENSSRGLLYMTAPNIPARHAFTTRAGGVSEGIYKSLNLSFSQGDAAENVLKNYGNLCAALGLSENGLVFSKQVHGDNVRICGRGDVHTLTEPVPYEADGLITAESGLPLIIFTADCVPVLLYDGYKGAVGAAHAGWRGTALDIAGKTARKMRDAFGCRPEDIRAAIGPCISACCFETGPEVPEAMRKAAGDAAENFISPQGGKFNVDLKGINRFLLMRAGLKPENICVSDECTMCLPDKYWSHRATGGARGSQASLIVLD